MEEIKVSEYVRTDCGTIIKVKKIEKDEETKDIWYYEAFCLGAWKSRVVKHSPDLIDLIEVGDYVNGHLVIKEKQSFTYASVEVENSIAKVEVISAQDIKSIVTKEQFEAMKYEVK